MIVRYLLVPSVMMSLFAAVALGGSRCFRAARAAAAVGVGAGVAVVLGLVWTAFHPPSFVRFNNELVFRGEPGRSLYALLDKPAVKKGLRCGPLSVPTHKLIPDTRWILDLPQRACSPAPRSRRRHGGGCATASRSFRRPARTSCGTPISTTGTKSIVAVPPPGFERVAVDRYFAAYARCPGPGA